MSIEATETLLSALQRVYEKTKGSDLLKGMREKAWDHFLELGLPEKSDAFKYVPLRRLYELDLSTRYAAVKKEEILPHIYPECRKSYIVFVNGAFLPELSDLSALPKKVVAVPIIEAMRSYGPFLQNRWSKALKEEPDPFAILNLALHPQGLFFYLPPKISLETPIQTLFISTDEQQFSPARLQLFLASQTEAEWITSTLGNGIHNTLLDLSLEDGASFTQTEVPLSGQGWHFNFLRATLKRDSRLKHFALTTGPRISRHSLRVQLQGENSDALLQGLWNLDKTSQAHTHVFVEHAAPHARSLQKYKGILRDTSQSSFEGKIYVRPEAQKTEAYQLNHNLLLSEAAIANAKPNLEIFADDVKASHGATFSQVDEEQLFYLKSRGISREEASRLLIRGFMQEMIDQIPRPSIRQGAYASF